MRFRSRHLQQTLARHVQAVLIDLGWVNDPVNFGTTPVTFLEVQPDADGVKVEPNTVAITLGDEPAQDDAAMGGEYSLSFPAFIDVYGVNSPIAVSIASDIKDQLTNRAILLMDYTGASPVVTDQYVEFEQAVMERPPASIGSTDFRRHWRVVKVEARVYFREGQ